MEEASKQSIENVKTPEGKNSIGSRLREAKMKCCVHLYFIKNILNCVAGKIKTNYADRDADE